MNVSLGFLNYNSFLYIEKQLQKDYFNLSNGVINEIIIQDDCSEDDFEKLKKIETQNIKVFKNEKRIKPLLGRINLVNNCNNDWVLLMDSDNFLDKKSFDSLFNNDIIFNSNTIYAPDFARPKFNYKAISNFNLDLNIVKNNFNYLICFLNIGNYLIPKKEYLNIAKKIDKKFSEYTMEVLYYNYLWLSSGNLIKCVKDYEYDHTMRDDCFSYANDKNFNEILPLITKLYLNNI
jgi:hypothetical protein